MRFGTGARPLSAGPHLSLAGGVDTLEPVSPSECPDQRVAVVIPARDEAARIAATVRACRAIPRVDLVARAHRAR